MSRKKECEGIALICSPYENLFVKHVLEASPPRASEEPGANGKAGAYS